MSDSPITAQDETQIARLIRLEVLMDEARKTGTEIKSLVADQMGGINVRLQQLDTRMDQQEGRYNSTFVSKQEFVPVRTVVYGFVAIVMVTVIGALLYLVIRQPS